MNLVPWPLSVPVLTDGEVTLRAHLPDDISPLVEMVTDPVTQNWTSVPTDYHQRAAEQFLAEVVTPGWDSGANRIWVVEVGGRFVGQVDLRGTGAVKEIAYVLHPAARGHGYTRAAVRLVLAHAFTELDTEVVTWRARVGNIASLKAAHACGFDFHATIPRLLHEKGRLHDAWVGSIGFGESTHAPRPWLESYLDGERIRLRPARERHVARWAEALGDAASSQYLVAVSGPLAATDAARRFAEVQWSTARGTACTWVITATDTDEFQGLIVADHLGGSGDTSTELEWLLHPDARGRGFMREAVELAVGHVLSPDGLDQGRVSAFVAAGNAASNRVAHTAGGQLFGTQSRSEPLGDGRFDDLNEYEWLR